MGINRRLLLAALALVAVVAASFAPVHAEPVSGPIDPEMPAPLRGVYDPNDFPQLAAPDPALLTLDVPAHPWMLFTAEEIPALRDRIAEGRAATPGDYASLWPVAVQYERMETYALQGCEVRGRCTYEDGVLTLEEWDGEPEPPGFESRDFGREDLAYYGVAYHLTDDAAKRSAILTNARALLRYVVASTPDHGAPLEPGVDEFYIQRAHRLNGLSWAYDLLHPALDPTERAQLREVITTLARQQFAHARTAWWGTVSSGSNIGAHNGAALAQAGLALWHDTPESRDWLLRGEQIVRSYFHEGFDDTGASLEGILYGNYGMMVSTYLMHALRQAGHDHDLSRVGGVDRHQEWAIYELLPEGGAVNPTNDARYLEFNDVFSMWSSTHGDRPELSRWLINQVMERWQGGPGTGRQIPTTLWYQPPVDGFDPNDHYPDSQVFAGRGLASFRSGWGPGETLAAFEARQNDWGEGVHHNQDVNSFQLYADGARLVVDSRYANGLNVFDVGADRDGIETSASDAHNTIVADGRSQDFLGKGDLQATSLAATNGLADLALGDARMAWIVDQPEQAERYFAYVPADPATGAEEYVIVGDRFTQGDGEHDYTSYLHTDWTNTLTVTSSGDGVEQPITACVTAPSHDESLLAAGKPAHPYRWFLDTPAGQEPATVERDVVMAATIVTAEPTSATVGAFTPLDRKDWERYRLQDTSKRTQPRLELSSSGAAFQSLAVLVPGAAHPGQPCGHGPRVTQEVSPDGDALILAVNHRSGAFDRVTLALDASHDGPAFHLERRARGTTTSVSIDPSQADIDDEPLADQLADDPAAAAGRVAGATPPA